MCMVSIISRWLQKRMPSFEKIESKLTKEEVENNKDITNNLKLNIFWFFAMAVTFVACQHEKFYLLSYPALLNFVMSAISIYFSLYLSRQFVILKYKIYMFMLGLTLIFGYFIIGGGIIEFVGNPILLVILGFIIVLCIKKIIFGDVMKSTKYEWVLNIGSFIALLTSIWEVFFGKGNFEEFIEAIFVIIIFTLIYKVALNACANHYKTLFYLLAYPEEFRKKFGYSIKEWYGVYSPQYKAKKDQ